MQSDDMNFSLGGFDFSELDFPYWEQIIIREWLADSSDHEELMQQDAWTLWEAVFFRIFKKPKCAAFDSKDMPDFRFKVLAMADKMQIDRSALWDQLRDLSGLHDRVVRAIAAERLAATFVAQQEFVIPKDFMVWADANKLGNEDEEPSIKLLRPQVLQKIMAFRRSQTGQQLSTKECLCHPEMRFYVEVFRRSSKNPENASATLKYLKDVLNKACPQFARKRGRPPAKENS